MENCWQSNSALNGRSPFWSCRFKAKRSLCYAHRHQSRRFILNTQGFLPASVSQPIRIFRCFHHFSAGNSCSRCTPKDPLLQGTQPVQVPCLVTAPSKSTPSPWEKDTPCWSSHACTEPGSESQNIWVTNCSRPGVWLSAFSECSTYSIEDMSGVQIKTPDLEVSVTPIQHHSIASTIRALFDIGNWTDPHWGRAQTKFCQQQFILHMQSWKCTVWDVT